VKRSLLADDVSILASMLEILVLVLEILLHDESSQLGLEVNWSEIKLQVFDDSVSLHLRCLYMAIMLRPCIGYAVYSTGTSI